MKPKQMSLVLKIVKRSLITAMVLAFLPLMLISAIILFWTVFGFFTGPITRFELLQLSFCTTTVAVTALGLRQSIRLWNSEPTLRNVLLLALLGLLTGGLYVLFWLAKAIGEFFTGG